MQNQPLHLRELNTPQREAATHTKGPLLIIAGAGAGKTRTITHRIVHLIKSGIDPQNILAVTFTNKAAKEMRERMRTLLNEDAEINRPINALSSGMSMPFMATFHSLGVHILRENYKELGIPRNFTIFDRADSLRAIKNALVRLDYDPKQYEPKTILGIISKAKGNNMNTEEFTGSAQGQSYYGEIAAKCWQEYNKALKKEGSLDFDDLLIKTHDLLANNTEVREKYQKRWQYIHIDEYQDTNTVQYDLVRLLVGPEQNICVVGDGDQCVYTWRQAKPENINNFEREFNNVKLVMLEQNYRSTSNILAAANDIITKNVNRKDKKLFTKNKGGEKISIYNAYSAGDEARYIVAECERLIESGTNPRDIAVLYRANFQSRNLEEQFLYNNVPYQVLGTKFFDRKEVKDVLSYLRAALNPQSTVDMTRAVSTPSRGIGKMTLTKMLDGTEHTLGPALQEKVRKFKNILTEIKHVANTRKPSETFTHIIKASGMEAKYKSGTEEEKERLENLKELVTLAGKYDNIEPIEGVERILQDAALATDQDELQEDNNAVKLMTVHASKGLEFDYVFITGMEEGLFPHQAMGDDESRDDEEERRLFYVAITRAGKKLYLTNAMTRTIYGKEQTNIPSHFLNDLNPEYTEDARAIADGWSGGCGDGGKVDPHTLRQGVRVDLIDF